VRLYKANARSRGGNTPRYVFVEPTPFFVRSGVGVGVDAGAQAPASGSGVKPQGFRSRKLGSQTIALLDVNSLTDTFFKVSLLFCLGVVGCQWFWRF